MRQYCVFFSVILLSACGGNASNEPAKAAVEAIPVEAATVERGDVSAYYATTATLEAENKATIVAKVGGVIQEVLVEEGDFVREGQPLARLDEAQYRLEVTRAEANLARLKSDFDRTKEMFERGLVSQEAFDRIKYEVESQQATLELAQLNVAYSTIRASIDGVVSRRDIRIGNMVTVNQSVFEITDNDPLRAVLHLPEHELAKIRTGQTALMEVDALGGETVAGRVSLISPVIDSQTGTFKVTVTVSGAGGRLKAGMFARVRIVYDTRMQTLVVPKNAVLNEDGLTSVFVVQDTLVFKRQVRVGYTNGTRVEILDGLEQGARVVTVGQNSLRDSSRVSIIGTR